MDDLPNELRAMLELTRDEYEPPDDAKQRVRLALAAAIGAPTAGAVLTGSKAAAMNSQAPAALAAKSGWLALGGKLTAAAVGTIAAAGIGLAVYSHRAPAVSVPAPALAPAQAPVVQPVIEPAAPSVAALPVKEAEHAPVPEARPRKVAPAPASDTLSDEMTLLRSASEALARGDEDAALVPLRTHAKRFPRGSLREERDGLRAIAECTRDQDPSQGAAQRFARQYPNSVLTARVAAACRAR
jgi:hypothetical protein